MELIFNELSFHPLASNSKIVEERFVELLNTFKEAKNTYGFTHMRFPQNYSEMSITSTETFAQWITELKTPTIKGLILPLFKRPFIDDLNEDEIAEFFQSSYTIDSPDTPNNSEPYGLPIAYIKSIPTISINSHPFWNNRKIVVNKTSQEDKENSSFNVYNICQKNDIHEVELSEWANKSYSLIITDEDTLTLYLSFSKYNITYSEVFLSQLLLWKERDIDTFRYILLLMKDVELHPFTGGMGKTENLRERGKEASKRITLAERLSYTLQSDTLNFIACQGHYKFH